jgi:hypothetical protein
MKTKALTYFGIVILLLSGCSVLSFYPLYTNDTLIRDDRIIGKWESQNDDQVWEISFPDTIKDGRYVESSVKQPNENTYLLKIYLGAKPDEWAEFWLHLVRLENKEVYVDLYPVNWNMDMEFLMLNMLSVHSFAKASIGDDIKLRWIDIEWLAKLIKENKIRIRHEENDAGSILLTAKPEELQDFLVKYGDDKDAYNDYYDKIWLKKTDH